MLFEKSPISYEETALKILFKESGYFFLTDFLNGMSQVVCYRLK